MPVALLAPGWEDNYEGNPEIYEIAGAGRIVAHQERADGTHDIILHGLNRVRLNELPSQGRPYRCARAELAPARAADVIADQLVVSPEERQRILETIDVSKRVGLVTQAVASLLAQLSEAHAPS